MDKNKIEHLAKDFTDENITTVYYEMIHHIKDQIYYYAKRYGIPLDETEFISNSAFSKSISNFNSEEGKFVNMFNANFKRLCINYLKKYTEAHIDPDSGTRYFVPKVEHYGIESEVANANAADDIAKFQKNSDQRQLIAYLLEDADENTRQSVTAFEQTGSFREAAKLLGKKDKNSVSRPIRKLARKYDGNRFGNYREYLIG